MISTSPENNVDNQDQITKPKISRLAIVSLILGILIISPGYGVLFAIAAIITGAVALRWIGRSQGKLTGRGLATAGIVLGIIGILFFPVIEGFQAMIMRNLPRRWVRPIVRHTGMGMIVYGSSASRVRGDMRSIATALEAYYQDYGSYPAWGKGDAGVNSLAGPKAGVFHIPTFRIWQNESEVGKFATLTTPVPYITYYPIDPFADTKGAAFGYYSDENGWILFSWGPDTDENDRDSWDLAPDVGQVYKSSISQPSLTLIAGSSSSHAHEAYTYDPSNGTISPGDIWRVKQ